MTTLQNMTQQRWDAMSPAQRDALRDLSSLNPQLTGLEGWRVEVTDNDGYKRRFIVGRSTGWKPCHIEVLRRNSYGGLPCWDHYADVRKLYRAR